MIKQVIKDLCPPAAWRLLSRARRRNAGWFGNFQSWQGAAAQSTGYDSKLILEKVKAAALRVKSGEAAFERDSVAFHEVEYRWPLLAWLMWTAASNQGRLRVLDFGGSLGSVYFQNRHFLGTLPDVRWNIVEQPHFVECGQQHFEDERLRFYHEFDDAIAASGSETLLLGGVLQYLERPYDWIDRFLRAGFQSIIIDRTPFGRSASDRITVQRVPASIYSGSYPSWVFSEQCLLAPFLARYHLLASCRDELDLLDGGEFKGFLLLKSDAAIT